MVKKNHLRQHFFSFLGSLVFSTLFLINPPSLSAVGLGIHILQPEEINEAVELFSSDLNEKPNSDTSSPVLHYVTIPFPLDEPLRPGAQEKWQKFFDESKKNTVVPLIRLTTTFDLEKGVWAIPTRYQLVTALNFLNQLRWPQPQKKHLIIFNEPNHHAEWGGQADPTSYAHILSFTSNWARTLDSNFYLLPAGLDLAAPNGPTTMEAFAYLDQMLIADPLILDRIDGWNSHSYPNPAFSSPPERTGQNSLIGYQKELDWLSTKNTRSFPVYITETGWEDNARTHANLKRYYQTAWDKIWNNDQRLVAVTPFLLRGAPGPFARFSLIDKDGQPTLQYEALSRIISQNRAEHQLNALDF